MKARPFLLIAVSIMCQISAPNYARLAYEAPTSRAATVLEAVYTIPAISFAILGVGCLVVAIVILCTKNPQR